jgi:hypothetical protein
MVGPLFRTPFGMVFAYAAVSAAQKPRQPVATKAVRQNCYVYLLSPAGARII